jgi:hypothetical protein|nr:MAG TPA: hypothetical protein [Caudoviricetes sp.]
MTEKEIIEVISNSHLGELYSELKEVYEKNKHKTVIDIDKELTLTLGGNSKVGYSIVTGIEHSDVLDEVFEKINECCDGQIPKGQPAGSVIYFSNKKKESGRAITSIIIKLAINEASVSFYFGYFKPATN